MEGLIKSGLAADVFLRGASEAQRSALERRSIRVFESPPPLEERLAECSLAVHYSGLGTATACLAAGRPQLLMPSELERWVTAATLKALGVAGVVGGKPEADEVAAVLRKAVDSDLEPLVAAARASLREEDRPDPCDGDPVGFRLWVRGRLYRARVVECDGQVAFVGYADVRRPEGWLIQGVYTWPYARRRGMAAAAMYGVVCEAFEAGTDHVQLAVIRGNTAAIGLYQKLGFSTFAELRTILFA